jgi:hypothetical protein
MQSLLMGMPLFWLMETLLETLALPGMIFRHTSSMQSKLSPQQSV